MYRPSGAGVGFAVVCPEAAAVLLCGVEKCCRVLSPSTETRPRAPGTLGARSLARKVVPPAV
ncbi:MAG: hypothetical protein E6I76_08010 [Chloroflexi bacterium]|nr:MAG: hypothetical protein E6I76_08010 [Chloroflexota bacterium]